MRKQTWLPCEISLPNWQQGDDLERLRDTAWGYLSRLRAWEGVCGEIDRSQSGIPMSSIGPMRLVHFGKMALADDIDLHVSRLSFSRVILKVL